MPCFESLFQTRLWNIRHLHLRLEQMRNMMRLEP